MIFDLSGEQMSVFALTASEYILFYDQITRVVIKSYLFLLISYLRCRRHRRTKHRSRSSWSLLSDSSFRPINRHSHFKNKDRISTEKWKIAAQNGDARLVLFVSAQLFAHWQWQSGILWTTLAPTFPLISPPFGETFKRIFDKILKFLHFNVK